MVHSGRDNHNFRGRGVGRGLEGVVAQEKKEFPEEMVCQNRSGLLEQDNTADGNIFPAVQVCQEVSPFPSNLHLISVNFPLVSHLIG